MVAANACLMLKISVGYHLTCKIQSWNNNFKLNDHWMNNINIIIMHADWLNEWATLICGRAVTGQRERDTCKARNNTTKDLGYMQLSLPLSVDLCRCSFSLSLSPSPLREKERKGERKKKKKGEREKKRKGERERGREREIF